MTLESPAYVISADSHSAELFRRTAGTMLSGTGVVGSSDLQVEQNGSPNMSVIVLAGQVWVPGTLGATSGMGSNLNAQTTYGLPSSFTSQGPYQAYQDAPANLAIAAADPTNPRIDLVCASVQDAQYSGSNNQAVLQVITGTAGPSPAPPSAPASTVVLAQVAVAAGATSITSGDITDERPFMTLHGTGSHYSADAYLSSTQPLAESTWTVVAFNAKTVDDSDSFNTSTGTYTCPVGGRYLVATGVELNTSTTGACFVAVYKNGVLVRQLAGSDLIYVADSPDVGGAAVIPCNAGDTLNVCIWQNSSTTAVSVQPGQSATWVDIDLVG